jgi:hypothetical protein
MLETATAFATIVSLLADFTGHRKQRTDRDYADFVAWLSENRHEEVVRLLNQNASTVTSIKSLLKQDRSTLLRRFDDLDRTLASLATAIGDIKPLAVAVRPGSELSEQGLRILEEFDASGAGKGIEVVTLSDRSLLLTDGGDGQIQFTDERFVDDDLNSLVESGLLRLERNSRGGRVFVFTRYASEYIRRLKRNA